MVESQQFNSLRIRNTYPPCSTGLYNMAAPSAATDLILLTTTSQTFEARYHDLDANIQREVGRLVLGDRHEYLKQIEQVPYEGGGDLIKRMGSPKDLMNQVEGGHQRRT